MSQQGPIGGSEYCHRSLERLSSVAKGRYLKHTCTFCLERLHSKTEDLTPDDTSNMFFYPLKLACESTEEGLAVIALDCIEKMLAHGMCAATIVYAPPTIPLPKSAWWESAPVVPVEPRPTGSLLFNVIQTICATLGRAVDEDETEMRQIIRALLTAVSAPCCALTGDLLLQAYQTCIDVHTQSKTVDTQNTSKVALCHIMGLVQSRRGEEGDDCEPTEFSEGPLSPNKTQFSSKSEMDCYRMFHLLCKKCERAPVSGTPPDSPTVRGNILCLQLLQHFAVSGHGLFEGPTFLRALRHALCPCVLHNCASPIAGVSRASARLLAQLLHLFRAKLKRETIIFFYNVIFPVLDSANSSFGQKSAILELLQSIAEDSQLLSDFFVNHDCVIGSQNLCGDIVLHLSKVVQTLHVMANWITPRQEEILKIDALKILVSLIKSITQWVESRMECEGSASVCSSKPPAESPRPSRDLANVEAVEAMVSPVVAAHVDDFQKLQKSKKVHEAVVVAFNRKPSEGIKLALEMNLLHDDSPAAIAAFFETPGLSKVQIGEYMSKRESRDILVAFIKTHDFSGMIIDEAMRLFLGKFKIVGEAQIVDLTMEKFAEHFCEQNPEAFASPGTAYVLAFSIMMLNTDAHSAHVKDKMSLQEFVRNNRGIDDGKDLLPEFLEQIYRRIVSKEIKLHGEPGGSKSAAQSKNPAEDDLFVSLEQKKAMRYKIESDTLIEKSLQMLNDEKKEGIEWTTATVPQVGRAIWEASWTAVLAAFSLPMEETDVPELVDICLKGFVEAMHLNCLVSTTTEREAFISSLATFTHLTSLREMEYKNLKSIDTLLQIAAREGNALESSWYDILKCVSLLDKLQLIGSRKPTTVSNRSFDLQKVEQFNAELITQNVDQVTVDKLFSNSGELGGPAVVYLVESLCRVSAEELMEAKNPRHYSLQKLVEVTEINIGRIRYVWSQMWVYLSKHFTTVGLSKQRNVALFAVDSLRQLAMKFLQRDELGNFNFQRDFLKPFEVVASQTKQVQIREIIVACLEQMVNSRASNIMSGWKIVLNTLGKCALDSHATIVQAAYNVLLRIVRSHLHFLATKELFVEVVATLSTFAGNYCHPEVASASVSFLELTAFLLANGIPSSSSPLYENLSAQQSTVEEICAAYREATSDKENIVFLTGEEGKADIKLWLSVFAGIGSLTNTAILSVRLEAVNALFRALHHFGDLFDLEEWQLIVGGTVFPIIENIVCDATVLPSSEINENGDSQNTPGGAGSTPSEFQVLGQTTKQLCQLYYDYFDVMHPMFPDVLNNIYVCLRHTDRRLADVGIDNLRVLLSSKSLSVSEWKGAAEKINQFVEFAATKTAPTLKDMLDDRSPEQKLESVTETMSQVCAIIRSVLHTVPHESLSQILASLRELFQFGCSAIDDGSMPHLSNSSLYKLERESCKSITDLLSFLDNYDAKIEWGITLLRRVKMKSKDDVEFEEVLSGVGVEYLTMVGRLDDQNFVNAVGQLLETTCALINCCDPALCDVLSTWMLRFGQLSIALRQKQ